MTTSDETLEIVQRKYAQAAIRSLDNSHAECGCGCGCGASGDPVTGNLYDVAQTEHLPERAVRASLGCGNPTALADLHPGEIVLDLGSGGGLDVLLSARRVGPAGKAYGLDMTDEMLELARQNQREAGIENAVFLKGRIEDIPLPDASVDVIISNCVINLSGDKGAALAEAFRVLRPGGRLAITDVVVRGPVPEVVRQNLELWAGCIAGALDVSEFESILRDVGFESVSIEPVRVYEIDDARAMLTAAGIDVDAVAQDVAGRFLSAFVRARKA